MRVLIQQVETGLFFKAPGAWTPDKNQAHQFPTSTEALYFCLQNLPGEMQIVFSFSDARFDLVIYPPERNF